ncbi:MAG: transketolase [Calditrichaeota bacterium]|nr:transketolase [Calditrichota bacterium]MBT7787592.1 transketolase [Calditrichota bacterium]
MNLDFSIQPPSTELISDLCEKARYIRRDVLLTITNAESGHPGGPLSMADYMTALFFKYLNIKPHKPNWEDRDRFVLSNGHASALQYALMAGRGYFPRAELLTFRATNSRLLGHPSSVMLPGIEISTGSLGQGLSVAQGMAMGCKLAGKNELTVYCSCGDGELQEGSIWEAVMSASHYKLDNLILMVDANNAQIDGYVEDVMRLEPLVDKFKSFGWQTIEADGHHMQSICESFELAQIRTGKPTVLLFKTTMMKGCPTYENIPGWHGRPPTPEECSGMLKELGFDETYEEARKTLAEDC